MLNYEHHIINFHDRFNYWCKTGSMKVLVEGTHPAGTPAPHMGDVEGRRLHLRHLLHPPPGRCPPRPHVHVAQSSQQALLLAPHELAAEDPAVVGEDYP